jgi:hypothetical protein
MSKRKREEKEEKEEEDTSSDDCDSDGETRTSLYCKILDLAKAKSETVITPEQVARFKETIRIISDPNVDGNHLKNIVQDAVLESSRIKDYFIYYEGRTNLNEGEAHYIDITLLLVKCSIRIDSLRKFYLSICLAQNVPLGDYKYDVPSFISTMENKDIEKRANSITGELSVIIGGNITKNSSTRKSHKEALCIAIYNYCDFPSEVCELVTSYDIFPTYKEYSLAVDILGRMLDITGIHSSNTSTWLNAVTENLFYKPNSHTLWMIASRYDRLCLVGCDCDVLVRFVTKTIEKFREHSTQVNLFIADVIMDYSVKFKEFHIQWIDILTKGGAFDRSSCVHKKDYSRLARALICGIALVDPGYFSTPVPLQDFKIDKRNGPAFLCAMLNDDPLNTLFKIAKNQTSGDEYYKDVILPILPKVRDLYRNSMTDLTSEDVSFDITRIKRSKRMKIVL